MSCTRGFALGEPGVPVICWAVRRYDADQTLGVHLIHAGCMRRPQRDFLRAVEPCDTLGKRGNEASAFWGWLADRDVAFWGSLASIIVLLILVYVEWIRPRLRDRKLK